MDGILGKSVAAHAGGLRADDHAWSARHLPARAIYSLDRIDRMPVKQGTTVEAAKGKNFEPLPADVYPVQILDIEEREGTKWQSSEVEMQINVKFVVIEEGPHYGRLLWATCSPKIAGGTKQSKLYQVIVAATGAEFTKEQLQKAHEIVTPDFLNSMIGQQLRLTVSVADKHDGSGKTNKVNAYMPKKVAMPEYDASKVKKDE